MVKCGTDDLTLGGTSALGWTIAAGGLMTAAERFAGDAAILSGAILTFDQAADRRRDGHM
ncbi:hypothetical protein [Kaistia algarum]|uniref:hypothetical protein n=1 Tax=Kaistia algarum TaxID=2083279 RepID=UPI002257EE0A|nr:hypothetical protein [Kaistia algarum]MCX5515364.1 hypothetical protein [Kaistia algarum]